jgi:glycosyltransferase involved in cell wall biosynthesis
VAEKLKEKNYLFLVIGKGRLREKLEKKAKGLPVAFIGWQAHEKIPYYLRASDCFVNTASWEGFGLSILEAFACETPVVAVDSGAVSELVQDRETGLLVEKNPEKVASAVIKVVENKKLRREMVREAKALSKKYTWNMSANKILRVYQELI